MLKLAWGYQDKLNQLTPELAYEEKYKYLSYGVYSDYNLEIDKNGWSLLQFVSVDREDNIIGYFEAAIARAEHIVTSLWVFNFYDVNLIFSKDFKQFFDDLFTKYNFRKVNFSVIIGNPAEKMYDKYIKKYNGRIVGIRKEDTKLFDNNYYDVKLYEIFRKDYMKSEE